MGPHRVAQEDSGADQRLGAGPDAQFQGLAYKQSLVMLTLQGATAAALIARRLHRSL